MRRVVQATLPAMIEEGKKVAEFSKCPWIRIDFFVDRFGNWKYQGDVEFITGVEFMYWASNNGFKQSNSLWMELLRDGLKVRMAAEYLKQSDKNVNVPQEPDDLILEYEKNQAAIRYWLFKQAVEYWTSNEPDSHILNKLENRTSNNYTDILKELQKEYKDIEKEGINIDSGLLERLQTPIKQA